MNIEEKLDYAMTLTWERMLTSWAPNSCIAGTSMFIQVAERMGATLMPCPVDCVVLNKKAFDLAERLGRIPEPEEECEGGLMICVGLHLVAVGHGHLWDVTIAQASRPDRGVVLEPIAIKTEPEFFRGASLGAITNELAIMYQVNAENTKWADARDWIEKRRQKPFVDAIMYDVERSLFCKKTRTNPDLCGQRGLA